MEILIQDASTRQTYKTFNYIKCKDIDNYINSLDTKVNIYIKNTTFNILGIHLKSLNVNDVIIENCVITRLYIRIPIKSEIYIYNSTISKFLYTSKALTIINSIIFDLECGTGKIYINYSRCNLNLYDIYLDTINIYDSVIFLNIIKTHINNYTMCESILQSVRIDSLENVKINNIDISHTILLSSKILACSEHVKLKETNLDFTIKDPITIYKKVKYVDCKGYLIDYAILTGHTYNDSLIHKGVGGKCRTNHCIFTKVERITGGDIPNDGILVSSYDDSFIYTLNKEIVIEDYDTSYAECSTGIHFFLTKEEAIKY